MSKKSDSKLNLISASEIKPASMDVETVRRRLAESKGPKYWRTLEELADEKAFGELLQREFPRQASEWVDPVSRRNFLKLAGASLAMAGLAGCTKQPLEPIVPYVRQPEDLVPGKPMFYATSMPFRGHGLPLLVESHEYRPTKVEGNREHPASMGASELFSQASILELYDPDRATTITHMGEHKPWGEFLKAMTLHVGNPTGIPEGIQRKLQGAGIRFLTGATSSPTMAWQMKEILRQFPQAKWHRYEPVHRDNARAGSKLAFGAVYDAIYRFASADVVVSLDADFLSGAWFPGFLNYARDFMGRRKTVQEMNRFYVAESSATTTGMKADHRLAAAPSAIEKIARALAVKLGVTGVDAEKLSGEEQKWVEAAAADLNRRRGKCLVVPGEFQAPAVHALAHAMNAALGNAGETVIYIDPVEVDPVEHTHSIAELAAEINAGKVEVLVIIGVNPVYDAPAELNFKDALAKMLGDKSTPKQIVHVSQQRDDTSEYAHWHIPEAHYLEAWSDVRAFDGTVSIIQPLLLPLYEGRSAHEILAVFTEQPGAAGYDIVRAYWQTQHSGPDFEQWWARVVHDGFIKDSASPARAVTAKLGALPAAAAVKGVEVSFRPDPCIYDGRFVNNGWLQETPKPLTRVTWDNVAMVSPAMAERLNLDKDLSARADHQSDAQNVIEISVPGTGTTVKAPYWPQPGHPDGAITLFLGYGQKYAGRVGAGHGYNAAVLRTSAGQYVAPGGTVAVAQGEYWSVAVTQGHFSMENRDPVKKLNLEEWEKLSDEGKRKHFNEEQPAEDETLYPDFRKQGYYEKYAWGMAIDLNSCIGCQTCAVACQAENNISVVGKDQVERGREMQWIRVDTYYEGDPATPSAYFQPVPCMQCEDAPCEPVCPVGATVHSTEGLNDMVYNRCVGTRYCSNNCPYKVRRFNFLLYADWDTPSLKMMRNPDVSVRSRGVMEKCTFCVQRINEARISAEKKSGPNGEEVLIQDGEVITACQQACPTGAIVFGNLNDKNSRVSRLKADPRNYSLLADINTRPRTTYIGAVLNPNPELGEKA